MDIRAAFYTVLPEIVLGRLLGVAEHAAFFAHIGLEASEIAAFESSYIL